MRVSNCDWFWISTLIWAVQRYSSYLVQCDSIEWCLCARWNRMTKLRIVTMWIWNQAKMFPSNFFQWFKWSDWILSIFLSIRQFLTNFPFCYLLFNKCQSNKSLSVNAKRNLSILNKITRCRCGSSWGDCTFCWLRSVLQLYLWFNEPVTHESVKLKYLCIRQHQIPLNQNILH